MANPDTIGLSPINAIALVGALGVGAQWLAWRLQLPGIVLMLLAGVLIGPIFGILDPARDIGPLVGPMVSVAVAIILFEGGMTLNLHRLNDASQGVKRLVVLGAPLGWLSSTAALHYGAGVGWQAAAVFGGIMIVTGPTVIAPLLRQAKLSRRPAALLQWEAIVNDPIGALAAVLAFEVVVVLNTAETITHATQALLVGVVVATLLGWIGGQGIARAFRRGWVPEYMKVPVLFVVLIAVFAASDTVLHESGLLAVTIMGLVIANADLPSYAELRRFKEHATILLVSGVFILLAASLDLSTLAQLNWRAGLFVALVILLARPLTVLVSLLGTDLPWRERVLVALTGPRGVVLVAVAGLFGERLAALGVPDGELVAPLAFVLVVATVVLHGFTLGPVARLLGLSGGRKPGVLLVGGSRFSLALAETLHKAEVPVLITDPNRSRLRAARQAGVRTYYGDILSEGAEEALELQQFDQIFALTDNDAYNTLVTTDLAPEFGRGNIFQLAHAKEGQAHHDLPSTLGGRGFADGQGYGELERAMRRGATLRLTRLTDAFGYSAWQAEAAGAQMLLAIDPKGMPHVQNADHSPVFGPEWQLIWMAPPEVATA
jgi:NhaP-type Na+/H+ or K+/H+ antiporter